MPPKAIEDSKMLNISRKEYLESQNEVVSVLNNHCAIAHGMITSFSMAMNSMNTALLRTRAVVKDVMAANNIDLNDAELKQQYPAVAELLSKDPSEIGSVGVQLSGVPLGFGGVPEKRKRKKREQKPKDPNAPKRPQTAFFLYLDLTRDAVGKQMGEGAKPGQIADEQRDRWRAMSDEEKEVYKKLYQVNFEQYKDTMKQFATPGVPAEGEQAQMADKPANNDEEEETDDDDDESESSESEDDDEEEEEPAPPVKKGRKTAAAAKKDDLMSKIDPRLQSPPQTAPQKSPERKGRKTAAAAATAVPPPSATITTEPKSAKKNAKAASPEEPKKRKGAAATAAAAVPPTPAPAAAGAEVVDTTASGKKRKRKSTGAEVEEKKKKRKETLGEDY